MLGWTIFGRLPAAFSFWKQVFHLVSATELVGDTPGSHATGIKS